MYYYYRVPYNKTHKRVTREGVEHALPLCRKTPPDDWDYRVPNNPWYYSTTTDDAHVDCKNCLRKMGAR